MNTIQHVADECETHDCIAGYILGDDGIIHITWQDESTNSYSDAEEAFAAIDAAELKWINQPHQQAYQDISMSELASTITKMSDGQCALIDFESPSEGQHYLEAESEIVTNTERLGMVPGRHMYIAIFTMPSHSTLDRSRPTVEAK